MAQSDDEAGVRRARRRESVEDGLPLRGFDRECHLILHRHPDRTEMRTCLSPIGGK